ncbi:MAG: hypothetical protein K5986_09260 [Clostridium sp.]|nr:hypothetical protein [Clostridium sp.]
MLDIVVLYRYSSSGGGIEKMNISGHHNDDGQWKFNISCSDKNDKFLGVLLFLSVIFYMYVKYLH